jgi:basic amino acid/polyamine antiporter, APA family
MTEPARSPAAPAGAGNPDALLVRALGVRQLAASIFNYTVGSGIFALPAFAVLQLGTAAPLAYFACAIVMALVVLCFAEAGSRVALTGGPYAYVETALGPFVGFVAGVLQFLTGLAAGAAVAVLFTRSVIALIPSRPMWLVTPLLLLVIAMLAIINMRGVQRSARMIEVVTIAKLFPLIAFVLVGAAFVQPSNLTWQDMPSASAVLSTAGVVIFAFSGIESALAPSGEVRNPNRTVPLASFIALGSATLLYLAVQWVAVGVQGPDLANNRTTPLADAAGSFAGPVGMTVMIVGASISMFGYLTVNLLAVPRCLFAFGRDGFLPRVLTSVHREHRTPHVAIVVYAVALIVLALSGTFEQLAVFANLTALILYILCGIGVWVLRKRDVRIEGAKPFLMPGGLLVPIGIFVTNVWLIYETAGKMDVLGLSLMFTLAAVLYAIRAFRLRGVAAGQSPST